MSSTTKVLAKGHWCSCELLLWWGRKLPPPILKPMKTIIFDLDGTLVLLSPILTLIADPDALQTLRERYTFALVSGSTRAEITNALKETGLAPLFNEALIVSKEDTTGGKASGEPFQEMQNRLTGTFVMLGDSDGDEAGTKIIAMPFVRVRSYSSLDEQKASFTRALEDAVTLLN